MHAITMSMIEYADILKVFKIAQKSWYLHANHSTYLIKFVYFMTQSRKIQSLKTI